MDGIQKDHGVDRLKRPLLPLLGNGQNSVCDAADRAVRNGYSLDILDMGLNIAGGHALGIHLQDFLLNYYEVSQQLPPQGKDWNEYLLQRNVLRERG